MNSSISDDVAMAFSSAVDGSYNDEDTLGFIRNWNEMGQIEIQNFWCLRLPVEDHSM